MRDARRRRVRRRRRCGRALAIDAALERLKGANERLARVVELRFFGGLSVEETAEALGASTATVKRDWRAARAFLLAALSASSP